MSDGACNKSATPGDEDARKKTVSMLFEREIGDWLEEVGGLSRKHFLMEEEQDTKVIAQCERYIREFGPGLIILRHGYVKCPATSPTRDSDYRLVDWQDRPQLPAPASTRLGSMKGDEAVDQGTLSLGSSGLVWDSRYRLMQSTEIGLRNRRAWWDELRQILQHIPLKAVRKHAQVHAFVDGKIRVLKEELHRERTKAQRNENKKAKAAKKGEGTASGVEVGTPGGSSIRQQVLRRVKSKHNPQIDAQCNLVRHVADDVIVTWREERGVELRLWFFEVLRVFLHTAKRGERGGGMADAGCAPSPSKVSMTVAKASSPFALASEDSSQLSTTKGEEEGDEEEGSKRKGSRQRWRYEDLDMAFRLHAAHLAEDLCKNAELQEDAKQVITTVSKVKDFLHAYHEAAQPPPSPLEDPSSDPCGPPLLRQHSSRSLLRDKDKHRDRSGSVRSLRSASSDSITQADELRTELPAAPSLTQQGSGGLGAERGSGSGSGSGRSLRSQRSLSRGRLPIQAGQKQVRLMVQADEVEGLRVTELDDVWANVKALGKSLPHPIDLETVLGNQVWILIFEEFRIHKLQSIDRVLRRLNKWLRICTGRIAPDTARRRFKAMVKGLFKGSNKPVTYKLFTTTALTILEDPALKDDFQRWATMESSLCTLTTVERSTFRGLLMDFIQCRHVTQAEIEAVAEQRRCKDRSGHRSRPPRGSFSRADVFEPNEFAMEAWFSGQGEQEEGRRTPRRPSSASASASASVSAGGASRRRTHSASPRPASCGPTGGAGGETAPLGRWSPALPRKSSKSMLRKASSRSLRDDLLDMSLDDTQGFHDEEEEEEVGLAYDYDREAEAAHDHRRSHGPPTALLAPAPKSNKAEDREGQGMDKAPRAPMRQSFDGLVMPAPVRPPAGYSLQAKAPAGVQEGGVCKEGGGGEGSSDSEGEETEAELIRLRSWDQEQGDEKEEGEEDEDDWIMFADGHIQPPELLRAPSLRGNAAWEGGMEGGKEDDAFLISDWEDSEGLEQRKSCVSADGSDILSSSIGHEDQDCKSSDQDSEIDVSFGQFSDVSAEECLTDDA